MCRVLVLTLASLTLAACGDSDGGSSLGPNEVRVSAETEGIGEWPVTVDNGVLRCEADAVYFRAPDGTEYAINGFAKGLSDGPDIEAIWDKQAGGMSEFIRRGLNLCG